MSVMDGFNLWLGKLLLGVSLLLGLVALIVLISLIVYLWQVLRWYLSSKVEPAIGQVWREGNRRYRVVAVSSDRVWARGPAYVGYFDQDFRWSQEDFRAMCKIRLIYLDRKATRAAKKQMNAAQVAE